MTPRLSSFFTKSYFSSFFRQESFPRVHIVVRHTLGIVLHEKKFLADFGHFRPKSIIRNFEHFDQNFSKFQNTILNIPSNFFWRFEDIKIFWYFWLRKFQSHKWVIVRNTCSLFFESSLVFWCILTYYPDIISCVVFVSSCVTFSIPLVFLQFVRLDFQLSSSSDQESKNVSFPSF